MDTTVRKGQLEKTVQMLVDKERENKALINILKEGLFERDGKIYMLTREMEDLKKEVRDQGKQIRMANDKCKKAEKLQVLLKSLLLKKIEGSQTDVPNQFNCPADDIELRVAELEAKMENNTREVHGGSSRTISHPPEVDIDGTSDALILGGHIRRQASAHPAMTHKKATTSVSPPIPRRRRRELKPVLPMFSFRAQGEDVVDNLHLDLDLVPDIVVTAKESVKANLNAAMQRQGHGHSMVGMAVNGQTASDLRSEGEKGENKRLRRRRLRRIRSAGRCGSLKTEETRSPSVQEVSQDHTSDFAEDTYWEW